MASSKSTTKMVAVGGALALGAVGVAFYMRQRQQQQNPGENAQKLEWSDERAAAIRAVRSACIVTNAVQAVLVNDDVLTKKDKSPVTVADFSAQALVNMELIRSMPADPVVGEEDSRDLAGIEGVYLRQQVVEHVNSALAATGGKAVSEACILGAIDHGNYGGGPEGRHWALDPIDGTKGFLRKEQYAVCLGLIVDGQVVLGVLGCPNLPVDWNKPDGEKGVMFVGVKGQGAFSLPLKEGGAETPISVSSIRDAADASFTESVESGHSSHDLSAKIAQILGVTKPSVRMDSQCKYAAVARGDSSIYLRLPTRKGYEEKIWDHVAGVAVIEAAGGRVTDIHGKPLDFSIGTTLKANKGVVATNGILHDEVIAAVTQVFGSKL